MKDCHYGDQSLVLLFSLYSGILIVVQNVIILRISGLEGIERTVLGSHLFPGFPHKLATKCGTSSEARDMLKAENSSIHRRDAMCI